MTLEERNEKLDAAKALVLRGWCQESYGLTENGDPIDSAAPDELAVAVCFCATGAIARVSHTAWEDKLLNNALFMACKKLGIHQSVVEYNDTGGRTKYEVAALFDHAKEQPL